MVQYTDIDGQRLAYERSGSGEPMILMHGWGCDHTHLSALAKVCAETHEVYNLDLPGFGSSPEPAEPWDVERYTRLIEAFARRMGLERPSLLGHSFGGRLALLYASRNAVGRLVLVDAAGVKPRRSLRYYLRVYSFKAMKAVAPLVLGRARAERLVEQTRARRGSADYAAASPVMRQVLVRAVNTDLRHVMGAIDAPTLLVWGEQDTATPMRDARIMQRRIRGARLVAFPGAGHFSWIDNPFGAAAAIRRFLKN